MIACTLTDRNRKNQGVLRHEEESRATSESCRKGQRSEGGGGSIFTPTLKSPKVKCNREREGHILSSTDLGLFSFLCAALAPRPPSLSLFCPLSAHFCLFHEAFIHLFWPTWPLARPAHAYKACQPYHVISPWGRADADGGRRAWGRGSGCGAGDDTRWGKIRRQSPCDQRWIEAGNRLELERGGGNRGCVCERFLGFMEGMMMSVGGGGGGRAISKQIRGALSASHTTTRASRRRLLRLSDV